MLDSQQFLASPQQTTAQLLRRGVASDLLAQVTQALKDRKALITHTEALRQQLNAESQKISLAVQAKDTSSIAAIKEQLRALKADIKAAEERLADALHKVDTLMLALPNMADADVPDGQSEADNIELRRVGDIVPQNFTPQDHTTLGENLGIIDFTQGAKLSGARFVVMRGAGAKLERALAQLMLDLATRHGYTEIAPPLLVHPEAMRGAGQYPKFVGESFETTNGEMVLIPTSEVPLVNLHRDDILKEESLPIRMAAYTPCFRKEAGSAGRDTRGLIRLHQFNKVELVSITAPQDSGTEHERITGHAEAVLQALKLPYRVITLCTGDLGFAAQKTYDIEVWLPASGKYREISSCSNCGDFQARRAAIRYRDAGGKTKFVHTLNGSGVAVGRALVAVMENYQREDGTIEVPEALRPYMGGITVIEPEQRS